MTAEQTGHHHTADEERRIREAALDKTIADSFPASDPPSSDPNPDDHSRMAYWLEMADGNVEGLFAMGDNPAVAGPNAGFERRAMARLKSLVVRDMVETETASFWYDSPEVRRGDLDTEEIETEVFLLPAAGHAEKAGTFTNTQPAPVW